VELFIAPEDPLEEYVADGVPELTTQTAWLGAGILAATALSGLYAVIRRRKERDEE
jgi:hypothetical protein